MADEGPNTEAVDVLAERDADDDAYLAELRKAMTDESPLGPREDDDAPMFDDRRGAAEVALRSPSLTRDGPSAFAPAPGQMPRMLPVLNAPWGR